MAFTNYTRASKFNQKRASSFFSVELIEAANPSMQGAQITATSNNELLVKLPPNALILDAYVYVKTASNAATTAVFALGTTDGGAQILSAANAKTLGKQGTFTGQSDTGTGKDVYLTRTVTGAATPAGKYVVVIEYLEYTKTNGELTNVQ